MRVSWNWLSELVDLSTLQGPQAQGGPEALAELLTRRGLEVEEVHSLSKGFESVVTAQILKRDKHPQSDRLSLCTVTLGKGEPLEIVCGAQNMKDGDKVALAQIGAHLPNGLKIAQSKIRGVTSNGMLCSEQELKLADTSEGILILPKDAPLGVPLAEFLGLDDTILTLKLTSNRGDCLSHFGLAREIAAALGKTPKEPKYKLVEGVAKSPIEIALEAGDAAPQFHGVYIEGAKIGPSPAWVVKKLEAVGSRSINNVVDATNLVMLELGHPLHAYDADKIAGKKIGVRLARAGEKLPLLDGTTVELAGTELVIVDGERAVGLAGVMGGGNSEVQDTTTRLFLECAEFSASLVRKASTRHQKKTDAAHRFERGVDPRGLHRAISRLATLVLELAGGQIKGASVAQLRQPSERKIAVKVEWFNRFLGTEISEAEIEKTLTALECRIRKNGGDWEVTPPSYRLDLAIREDLAEEVARSVGYDRIPSTTPKLTSAPTPLAAETAAQRQNVIDRAKGALVEAGLLETISFSFTSRAVLAQYGLESTAKLVNPLSEELEYLVPSLLPGLVQGALHNWRHHFGSDSLAIRLFELRPTFHTTGPIHAKSETETGVEEKWKLAFALSGPRYASGLRNEQGEVDFYDLKAVLETLFERLGSRGVRLLPLHASRNPKAGIGGLLHPGQSVEILAGNTVAGQAGLVHPRLAKELKLRAPLWVCEIDWEALARLSRGALQARTFKGWPEFPPMERDFALVVKSDVPADRIVQAAMKAGKPLAKVAKIFDIYRGSQVAEGMTSVAVRVIFFEEGRVLQESETEAASTQILQAWKKEGFELRG